ncbi:HSP20-like chaperone [Neocallimastix californiae]|jgi:HSP20 family molecular chaperone IbpA|uniref:HSP20-like chaperone n=1 Tax=Neocallimastix californiae TaxID=1754190 RepID=A0A1Y2AXT2_9FUNG|nr:HSP20-like chaperone [Neocallimastix californiae]|eukprot:ORY27403.1 HSP20-like chaperone [Neocallimastix californiae]
MAPPKNTKKTTKTTSTSAQTQTTQTTAAPGAPAASVPPAGVPPAGAPPMMPPMMPPPVVPVVPMVPMVPVAAPIPAPPKYPRIDRDDDEKNFYVYADVPGLTLKDLKVEIKEKMLVISGERKCPFKQSQPEPPKEGQEPELKLFPIIERYFGPFERKVPVPENVDINSHKSVVENGILVITFNKNQAKK